MSEAGICTPDGLQWVARFQPHGRKRMDALGDRDFVAGIELLPVSTCSGTGGDVSVALIKTFGLVERLLIEEPNALPQGREGMIDD